jgi:hypothetical protein
MQSEEVILKNVRLGPYPDIFKPGNKANSRGEYKYKATFMFDPESEQHQLVKNAMMKVAAAEYGANWRAIVGAMEGSKKCLRNGDMAVDTKGNIKPGFAGKWYVVASDLQKPRVVGGRKGPDNQFIELSPDGGKPYGGCWVNAKIHVRAMKAKDEAPNNIFAKLEAIQFLREDQPLGGGAPNTADGFEEIEDAEKATTADTADDIFG